MRANDQEFTIYSMSRVLQVSESGYYTWRNRGVGKRELKRKELEMAIRDLFEFSRGTYGSPRIFKQLKKKGYKCCVKHIADVMRESGIRAKAAYKYKSTTDSNHSHPVAPNLVNRGLRPIRPDLIWVSDITYIRTSEGWLYLCVFIDLYSRKVVGWSMSERMKADLVIDAFKDALQRRKPANGLIVHSDQGSQYASNKFRRLLALEGCVQSMSRRGNCWDNAVSESFFHTLKVELVHDSVFQTRNSAKLQIFEYIEVFYNRDRLHSANLYLSPNDFESIRKVA